MEVKREAGRVWIDGIEGFGPGQYAGSPQGCQARILEAVGEKLTYEDLVCYGGFAFRIQVHEQMCPSAAHPWCGYQCMEGSNRALPWRVRLFESLPGAEAPKDRAAFEAEACGAIRDSIDRGVPVHYGREEDGLIIGYADEGRRWWCVHPYHKGGKERFWHDEVTGFAGGTWPWGIVVWVEPKPEAERVSDGDLMASGLRQGLDMWSAEKREAYFVGDAAYEHWLGWLRGADGGTIDDPKGGMQGNGWCFDVLVHSRRIAGRWLERRASDAGERAEKGLRAAAGHYARIAELCMRDLISPWDLALPPGRFDEWTSDLRREQIERLEAARQSDRAAVEAIRQALGPEG